MGLVLDTSVFIRAERSDLPDFSSWINHGEVFISVMTVSERLVGVHRADNESRRARRSAVIVQTPPPQPSPTRGEGAKNQRLTFLGPPAVRGGLNGYVPLL